LSVIAVKPLVLSEADKWIDAAESLEFF